MSNQNAEGIAYPDRKEFAAERSRADSSKDRNNHSVSDGKVLEEMLVVRISQTRLRWGAMAECTGLDEERTAQLVWQAFFQGKRTSVVVACICPSVPETTMENTGKGLRCSTGLLFHIHSAGCFDSVYMAPTFPFLHWRGSVVKSWF